MASLKWAPLPDGRPWWPAVVIGDPSALDKNRHPEALRFWNEQRACRGNDELNKDTLVLLCGLAPASDTDNG